MILDGPTLYLFSGLPGSGKSTLAQAIAQRLQCMAGTKIASQHT